ncbi:beta-N-acetylhexosaminidase [Rhodoplanes sp. SY1]|uniref:beta-N-acetylhexosaminidase n=1 Tax=Rhodoplanes sp. SY1 TaxID=3166646 RepID=UPI0038B499F7
MTARAFITGVSGLRLTDAERQFLRTARPFGLILFKRNVDAPSQVSALVDEFRDAVGAEATVLVDQEGGRVQRLGPPHWPAYPAGAWYGALHARDPQAGLAAARLGARLIAADLFSLGITVDCLPVADVPAPEGDPVIGDRAYGTSPDVVAALAAAAAEGVMAGGVLPVVKHMPGHGRAACDSHKALPVVAADRATLEATDVAAFRPLAGLPFGMTAHVVYTALDPDRPATLSPTIVGEVIRGAIGFSGALMTDDLSMGALSGSLAERTRAALAAGCDLALHCNGNLVEMEQVAAESPDLAGAAALRCAAALAARRPPDGIDLAEARAAFSRMIAAS